MMKNTIAGWLSVAALALLVSGCGQGGAASHKTPEDVFKAAKAAAEKEDFKTFADCLTDEARDQMAGGMVMAAVMIKGLGALGGDKGPDFKPINDALARHGITDDFLKSMEKGPKEGSKKEMLNKLVAPIKDRSAFVGDMMKALGSTSKDKGGDTPLKGAELKNVKTEGDTARGEVVTGGKSEPITFKKVGGGWRIELPENAMGGP